MLDTVLCYVLIKSLIAPDKEGDETQRKLNIIFHTLQRISDMKYM